MSPEQRAEYWKAHLDVLAPLLILWFLVSLGCGILLVEPLNALRLGGYPLGFWFAQQGAIYVFVLLVFFHALMMNRLDRRFGVAEDTRDAEAEGAEATEHAGGDR